MNRLVRSGTKYLLPGKYNFSVLCDTVPMLNQAHFDISKKFRQTKVNAIVESSFRGLGSTLTDRREIYFSTAFLNGITTLFAHFAVKVGFLVYKIYEQDLAKMKSNDFSSEKCEVTEEDVDNLVASLKIMDTENFAKPVEQNVSLPVDVLYRNAIETSPYLALL